MASETQKALESVLRLAEEAMAEREASDNPEDHELLPAYRRDVETARAAIERMETQGETVGVMAGPGGLAHAFHVMAAHVGDSVVTGARRDRPFSMLWADPEEMARALERAGESAYNVADHGEGEEPPAPSKPGPMDLFAERVLNPKAKAGTHGKAAARMRDRTEGKRARISATSKRVGKP